MTKPGVFAGQVGGRDVGLEGRTEGTVPYPVVTSRRLPPVERVWYRRRRREPTDIPLARPGCVYVFKAHGEYVCRDAEYLQLADEIVVHATSVTIVDVWPRRLPVDITIAPARPDEDVIIRSTFRCRVSEPTAVAQAGLTDLDLVLASHLASDDELGCLAGHAIGHELESHRLAEARVRALVTVAPPEVPGVEISLIQVRVRVVTAIPGPFRIEDGFGSEGGFLGGRRFPGEDGFLGEGGVRAGQDRARGAA